MKISKHKHSYYVLLYFFMLHSCHNRVLNIYLKLRILFHFSQVTVIHCWLLGLLFSCFNILLVTMLCVSPFVILSLCFPRSTICGAAHHLPFDTCWDAPCFPLQRWHLIGRPCSPVPGDDQWNEVYWWKPFCGQHGLFCPLCRGLVIKDLLNSQRMWIGSFYWGKKFCQFVLNVCMNKTYQRNFNILMLSFKDSSTTEPLNN